MMLQRHDLRAIAKRAVRSMRLSKQLNLEVLSRISTPHNLSTASMDSMLHGEASGKAALALFNGNSPQSVVLGPRPATEYVQRPTVSCFATLVSLAPAL